MLKIAIFSTSPSAIRLHEALRLMHLLRHHSGHDDPYVVFGVLQDTPAEKWCRTHPLPLWDELRPYTWQEMDWVTLARSFGIITEYGRYVRPLDGALDFRDCDFWIFAAGIPQLALPPLVPYGLHVTELPALARSPSPELGGALLKNVRNADLLLFPTDDYARYWVDMALVYDERRSLVGVCHGTNDMVDGDSPPYNVDGKYALFMKTLLLEGGAFFNPDPCEKVNNDDICLVPIRKGKIKRKGKINWNDVSLPPLDWSLVESLVARSMLVIAGPILDPCDIRLQAIRRSGRKPLMLWRTDWQHPPAWLQREVLLHFDDDPMPLEQRVRMLLRDGEREPMDGTGIDALPSLNAGAVLARIREVVGA